MKRIVIFSPIAEKTVTDVIKWLLQRGIPFKRLNSEDAYSIHLYQLSTIEIDCTIISNDSFWYRKGALAPEKVVVTNVLLSRPIEKYLHLE
jgi:hypothetical protein